MTNSQLAQVIHNFDAFSDKGKELLRHRFRNETITADDDYDDLTEYRWVDLCYQLDIPEDSDKTTEAEELSEAFFMLYDIDSDCYLVECAPDVP